MPAANQQLSPFDINRWFPSEFNRGPNWLIWIGLLASFTAVFIKLWTPTSINRIPEALYTLPFFYALAVNFAWLKRDRIIQLFGLAIVLPIVFYGINYLRDPILAAEYESLDKLVKLFFFVPIAWWLGGNRRTLLIFLAIAFMGLLVALPVNSDLQEQWSRIQRSIRVDYGIMNAQHVAQFFGIALIGFLALGAYSWHIEKKNRKVILFSLTAIGALLAAFIVLTTQTRAAVLALLVCTAIAAITVGVRLVRERRHWHYKAGFAAMIVLALVIALPFSTVITKRLQAEQPTINAIMEGDWANIPASNLGVRVNTALAAFDWIVERPLIGWGGDVNGPVIETSDRLTDSIKNNFGHFHNTAIEFTLAYGLLGLALLLALYITLAKNAYEMTRTNTATAPIGLFTLYTLVFMAIINQFESFLFFYSGVFANSVAFAPIYSIMLAKRLTQHKK
ncbi:O-antigen ligase family protein [Saccharospirillum sp.]|uniref:O-antigen ligase family protein n=1 Tax=Saccharospirillum sp. TaxID=2033801 RepID=UPI00349FF6CF